MSFSTPNLTYIIYIMTRKVAADFDVRFSNCSVCTDVLYVLFMIYFHYIFMNNLLLKHRLCLHVLCRLWLQSYHILTCLITNS